MKSTKDKGKISKQPCFDQREYDEMLLDQGHFECHTRPDQASASLEHELHGYLAQLLSNLHQEKQPALYNNEIANQMRQGQADTIVTPLPQQLNLFEQRQVGSFPREETPVNPDFTSFHCPNPVQSSDLNELQSPNHSNGSESKDDSDNGRQLVLFVLQYLYFHI